MKRVLVLVAALALTLLAGGAAFAQNDSSGPARVRVVHASPDAPAVNVLIDGRVVVGHLAYGQIVGYIPLEAGRYNVKVVSADRNQTVVIDADLDLAADTDYTIAAVGLLANLEPLVLVDNNELPEAGKARVRFVHASPDAPAVDVVVKDGDPLFKDVAFKGVGDYLEVDAGGYDLQVRLAGTDTVALELPWVHLPPGSVSTVFAIGLAGGGEPALAALTLVDARFRMHPPYWNRGFPRCPWHCGYRFMPPHPPRFHMPWGMPGYYHPPRFHPYPGYQGYGHHFDRGSYNYGHNPHRYWW